MTRHRAATRALLLAERTALNLLCHLSGVATATRALGRRGRRHRCGRPRHPQDDAAAAGAGEVRRALRRRREPPDVAVRRGAGQGQPRGRGGRGRRGVPGGARGVPRRAGRGRGRQRRRSRRGGRPPVPTSCCWTTSRSPRSREAVEAVAGRARLEASGGLTLDAARASPRPASTTSRSGRSPTRPRSSTSPSTCARSADDAARHRRRQHPHRARPLRRRGGRRALADRDRARPHRRRDRGACCGAAGPTVRTDRRRRHRALLDGAVGAARDARDGARATSPTCRRSSSSPACAPACRC